MIVALPADDDPIHRIGTEDKHATLVYLGHFGEDGDGAPALRDYPEDTKRHLLKVVSRVALGQPATIEAEFKGTDELGDEGAQVVRLSQDGPLTEIRDALMADQEIGSLYAQGTFTKYDSFEPHITLGYGDDVTEDHLDQTDELTEITFDRLALWWGDEKIEIPFPDEDGDAETTLA